MWLGLFLAGVFFGDFFGVGVFFGFLAVLFN
jgi:hypothetical protein